MVRVKATRQPANGPSAPVRRRRSSIHPRTLPAIVPFVLPPKVGVGKGACGRSDILFVQADADGEADRRRCGRG